MEAIATRKPDGKTLAIEHTIIEPFVGEKEDFSFFSKAFLEIEKYDTLRVPDWWIRVFVGVGTLHGQHKPAARNAIVTAGHTWVRGNRLSLPLGYSAHSCLVRSIPGAATREVMLCTKVVPLRGAGKLNVRRQQIENNLGAVVEKALNKKLAKLAKTTAQKRILLLERQHMNLYPEQILREIEMRRPAFSELECIHGIGILETIAFDTDSYLRFERHENGQIISSLDFLGSEIFDC